MCFSKNALFLEWKAILVPYPTRNTFWWICYGLVVMKSISYSAVINATHLYYVPKENSYYRWAEGVCVNLLSPASLSCRFIAAPIW
ncbi:hypothetical protein HJFPF1_02360 [Paramyrothecium foliicola]|nr:hypothetical protein HJFPF1_02360 [Paramyrothecium foliicola]